MDKTQNTESIEGYGYIDPRYTFASFVVAPNNELCVSACRSVADQPGEIHNPLYIYGGYGLGKTHLLHAIANALTATSKMRIMCKSAARFTNEIIAAIRNGTTQEFPHQYQAVDVLMVDDVQFFAGKPSSQKEFTCTLNVLHDLKKQVILTASVPPDEINKLDESICSRFKSGLATEIKPPNFETRLLILAKKAEGCGASLDDDVLALLASRFTTNIRELEGALTKLIAYATLTDEIMNLDLAKHLLRD